MPEIYSADKIFTGFTWITSHSLVVDSGIITGIVPEQEIEPARVIRYDNCFIAPAFIDLQIYGANKKLFSVYPSPGTLQQVYLYEKSGGANHFMPTVATNTKEVLFNCIDAVKDYWSQGGKGVLGLHVEGPWINKIKRGAHIEALVHSPELGEVKELLDYGTGVIKIITLAPEVCSNEVISLIRSYGVIIAAGHSNATCDEALRAFNGGIFLATHLFNAMSQFQSREPGITGAVMHHENVACSIIPDGIHVDFVALSIAKKAMGERLFMITDAVTETSEGPYPHTREGDKYVAGGILSGSALTMAKGVRNCVEKAGVDLAEALRMASLYPAKVIGYENRLGQIFEGGPAEFVVMDYDLNVVDPYTP